MNNRTPLLNEDGTASIATAMLMSHHAFRRDIARFATALANLTPGDQARATALAGEWGNYRWALHSHHEVEDQSMFPGMRTQHPNLGPVFDQLGADHRRIDPLLEQGVDAFATLAEGPATAAAVVSQLATLLDQHLTLEEAHVIQFLRGAKTFPPFPDGAIEMYAQGFAWSSDGVAPEVLERVYDMLPAALRALMPGARAAFEERRARVWGSIPSGASRTSVPE
jgi:hemerythrin-like domain-containing protein